MQVSVYIIIICYNATNYVGLNFLIRFVTTFKNNTYCSVARFICDS